MAVNSNVDITFPIAGQDQDSKGFRDNFAVIKTEIENLQSKFINVTGDVSGSSLIFDQSNTPVTMNLVLSNTGVTAGTYTNANITVDAKGRITSITNNPAASGFMINAIGPWNFDVGTSPAIENRNDIDVARFAAATDTAIYYDFIVPPQYDPTSVIKFHSKWAPVASQVAATIVFGLDWQVNGATAAFNTTNIDYTPDVAIDPSSTLIQEVSWNIPVSAFNAGDFVSLRLGRYADASGLSSGNVITSDNYTSGVDFYGASIEQS